MDVDRYLECDTNPVLPISMYQHVMWPWRGLPLISWLMTIIFLMKQFVVWSKWQILFHKVFAKSQPTNGG
jgi:hypothetical protein